MKHYYLFVALIVALVILADACDVLPGAPGPSPTPPVPPAETATVERIVDGDTIRVSGHDESVRMLNYDSPETHGGVECGGREATIALTSLIPPGTPVQLEADDDLRDRYGRFLYHVYTDSIHVNLQMVRLGWGTVVIYPPNDLHEEPMRQAEQYARENGRGIWSLCPTGTETP